MSLKKLKRAYFGSKLLYVVDLLASYSNRTDMAADLAILLRQLTQASKDTRSIGRRSVRTEQPPSPQRITNRLTDTDICELVAAFREGTPKWQLAERYGISLSSVKRLLRRHHTA